MDSLFLPLNLENRTGAVTLLFPHAGHLPLFYRPLATHLPGASYLLRRRGYDGLPWAELVEQVAQCVAKTHPGPPAVFGHSMGGLLAFDVALRLEALGVSPRRVVLSGAPPPDAEQRARHRRLSEGNDEELWAFAEEMTGVLPFTARDKRELIALLRQDMLLLAGRPETDMARFGGALEVLVSDRDPLAPAASMERWREVASVVRLHQFDGNHFFLRTAWPRVARLLEDVVKDLHG
jgi:surfactin synthase thioesterase subunit